MTEQAEAATKVTRWPFFAKIQMAEPGNVASAPRAVALFSGLSTDELRLLSARAQEVRGWRVAVLRGRPSGHLNHRNINGWILPIPPLPKLKSKEGHEQLQRQKNTRFAFR